MLFPVEEASVLVVVTPFLETLFSVSPPVHFLPTLIVFFSGSVVKQ